MEPGFPLVKMKFNSKNKNTIEKREKTKLQKKNGDRKLMENQGKKRNKKKEEKLRTFKMMILDEMVEVLVRVIILNIREKSRFLESG